MTQPLPRFTRWAGVVLGLAVLGLGATTAQAHGGTVRVNDMVGPYHLVVSTGPAPAVGDVLLTVIITRPEDVGNDLAVVGAAVTATFTLSDTAAPPPPTVYAIPPDKAVASDGYYDRTVTVPGDGTWDVQVAVSSPAGSAAVRFPVTLRRPPPGTDWLLWGVAALPIVVGVGLFLYLVRGMRTAADDPPLIEEDEDEEPLAATTGRE